MHPAVNKIEEVLDRCHYSVNRIEMLCPATEEETQSNINFLRRHLYLLPEDPRVFKSSGTLNSEDEKNSIRIMSKRELASHVCTERQVLVTVKHATFHFVKILSSEDFLPIQIK